MGLPPSATAVGVLPARSVRRRLTMTIVPVLGDRPSTGRSTSAASRGTRCRRSFPVTFEVMVLFAAASAPCSRSSGGRDSAGAAVAGVRSRVTDDWFAPCSVRPTTGFALVAGRVGSRPFWIERRLRPCGPRCQPRPQARQRPEGPEEISRDGQASHHRAGRTLVDLDRPQRRRAHRTGHQSDRRVLSGTWCAR